LGFGDPHFTTLDDRGYTFNGLGEYTLIRIGNDSVREFELQGRTALATGSMATQFSAFAFGLPSQAVIEVGNLNHHSLTPPPLHPRPPNN
jgi:hypothetical protein